MEDQKINPEHESGEQDLRHALYVQALAGLLFDETIRLHELGETSRHLLAEAAILQAQVKPQKKKKALKMARKLVSDGYADTLDAVEQDVLAAVAVFADGKFKRKDFADLQLDPMQEREAMTLTALLRIANGLDESNTQKTSIKQTEVSNEKIWIVVESPDVSVDAAAAQYNASLWQKVGYPRMEILESSEAQKVIPPFPEPLDAPGVMPEDSMAEAGVKIFRFHFANMLNYEAGTRSGEEIEDLHKMRVATRRMRAAFIVFEDAYKAKYIRPYLKGLRASGRVLGRVRDLDVQLDNARRYQAGLNEEQRPGMEPLIEAWENSREEARHNLCDYLDGEDYAAFKRTFNLFLNNPDPGKLPVPENQPYPDRVKEIAPILIYERLATVRAYEPYLIDASIETLHALRIEIKRLRYTVEFFQDILGPEVDGIIKELKGLQEHLGELNDDQIAAHEIARFTGETDLDQEQLPISERKNPESIVSYMAHNHNELHRLTASFADVWADFNREEFRRNLALSISVL